jgi:hypothetical protein
MVAGRGRIAEAIRVRAPRDVIVESQKSRHTAATPAATRIGFGELSDICHSFHAAYSISYLSRPPIQPFPPFDCPASSRGIFFHGGVEVFVRSSVVMGRTCSVGGSPGVRIEPCVGDGRRGAKGGNLPLHEQRRPRSSLREFVGTRVGRPRLIVGAGHPRTPARRRAPAAIPCCGRGPRCGRDAPSRAIQRRVDARARWRVVLPRRWRAA